MNYNGGILFDKNAQHLTGSSYDKILNELHVFNFRDKSGKEIINKLISQKDYWQRLSTVFLDVLCRNVSSKGWVDIEEEYYRLLRYGALKYSGVKSTDHFNIGDRPILVHPKELNNQLRFLSDRLAGYLNNISREIHFNHQILKLLKRPIKRNEIAIRSMKNYEDYCDFLISQNESELRFQWAKFNLNSSSAFASYSQYKKWLSEKSKDSTLSNKEFPQELCLPQKILLLSFNYTPVVDKYLEDNNPYIEVNHIHGTSQSPESIIFGYGDELDDYYKAIQNLNDNEYLRNIKSIRYLESDNYRNLLALMDSDYFQIYIMGHSCGTSDRTLLNTMFEHRNCVSIMPFYYEHDGKDNYMDIIQNISRCFTDMSVMRDKIVNKKYCEPLPQQC